MPCEDHVDCPNKPHMLKQVKVEPPALQEVPVLFQAVGVCGADLKARKIIKAVLVVDGTESPS